jgi:hypothetical protein
MLTVGMMNVMAPLFYPCVPAAIEGLTKSLICSIIVEEKRLTRQYNKVFLSSEVSWLVLNLALGLAHFGLWACLL